MKKYKPLTLPAKFFHGHLLVTLYMQAASGGILMVLAKLGSPENIGQFYTGFSTNCPKFSC